MVTDLKVIERGIRHDAWCASRGQAQPPCDCGAVAALAALSRLEAQQPKPPIELPGGSALKFEHAGGSPVPPPATSVESRGSGEAGATPPVECAKCTELWSAFWSLSARCSATVDALIGRRDSLHAENQRLREQVAEFSKVLALCVEVIGFMRVPKGKGFTRRYLARDGALHRAAALLAEHTQAQSSESQPKEEAL